MLTSLAMVALLAVAPQEPAAAPDPVARLQAALAAAATAHGEASLEVAAQLIRLGGALAPRDGYAAVLPLYERALAIREAKLPAGHAHIAVARVNLAAAHLGLHDPATAKPLLERVRDEHASGEPSRIHAGALTNLGVCEVLLGNYTAAACALEAAVVYLRQHFPEHTYLATALQNLAQVRLNQGEVETARRLVEETIAVLERTDPGGLRHAHALFGLGVALQRAERLDEAEALLRRSLAMRDGLLPADHPDRGENDFQLGWIACLRGNLSSSREHLERSLALGGGRSSAAVRRHTTLARTLLRLGLHDQAARHAQAASALVDELRMPPLQALDLLFCRAELAAAAGDLEQSVLHWRRLLDVTRGANPEAAFEARSALAATLLRRGDVQEASMLLAANVQAFADLLTRVLPAMFEQERLRFVQLHRRDLDSLLECLALHPATTSPRDAYAALLAWKGQVARGVRDQLGSARADADTMPRLRRLREIASDEARGRVDESLRRERERLLGALGDGHGAGRPPAPAAVSSALAADEALLDYVVSARRDGTEHCLVFVVRSGGVEFRDLGPVGPVGAVVQQHVLLASRSVERGAERHARAGAAAARAAVLAPVQELLRGCRRLRISPDAVLATLPFETLPGERDGSYLLEEVAVSYLQNAAQLLEAPAARAADAVVALGGIDYGTGAAPAAAQSRVPRPFAGLPQTRAEVAAIVAACGDVPCTSLSGGDASEARLREVAGGATVLHFATHGYYGAGTPGEAADAGIALAGANAPTGDDDGILTAGEAALLDLRACRVVVLSACQSGLGTPFGGEGLLGLRRSLHVAGAACTVTALWSVGDAATAELIADFYRALIRDSLPPAAALRSAQLQALARARAACGEGLPGRWGAFVCEGR